MWRHTHACCAYLCVFSTLTSSLRVRLCNLAQNSVRQPNTKQAISRTSPEQHHTQRKLYHGVAGTFCDCLHTAHRHT
jgi:hypothetical protein